VTDEIWDLYRKHTSGNHAIGGKEFPRIQFIPESMYDDLLYLEGLEYLPGWFIPYAGIVGAPLMYVYFQCFCREIRGRLLFS
jgi:hypothetical protein